MKIFDDIKPCDFEDESWHADYFWEKLHEANLEDAFNAYAEEMFPNGVGKTEFNDWIRFSVDEILKALLGDDKELNESVKTHKKRGKVKECSKNAITIEQLKKLIK